MTKSVIQRDFTKMDPEDWIGFLENTNCVVYFALAADNEWWLAHDSETTIEDEFDGPFHLWSTYPSGPWHHSKMTRGVMKHHLEEIYWVDCGEEKCDIRWFKTGPLSSAPGFVKNEIESPEPRTVVHRVVQAEPEREPSFLRRLLGLE